MELTPVRAWVPPVAHRQAGAFTARQALDAGLTAGQVRHRRDAGLWVRHAGAAWRHRDLAPTPWTDAIATFLTWPDAVVCLHTAAQVHRLPVERDAVVRAVVRHGRRPQVGLVPMRYQLASRDVVRQTGFALTTVSRTVLDLIGHLPRADAEGLLIWALTRRRVTHAALTDMVDAQPGLAGHAQRRQLLEATRNGAMSVAEQRLHRLLHRAGITGWDADQPLRDVAGVIGSADVLFPAERLVIEVDGLAFHGAARFQQDRTRQNRLVNAGYTVLRFTWSDLVDRPDLVLTQTTRALARARRAGSRGARSA